MENWPIWIPNLRSWVNAIALTLLIIGSQFISSYLWLIINWLIRLSPQLGMAIYLLMFLFPIGLIAFVHHWLHRFLDQFFPESRLPETETVSGAFPGLMSWWQGLYGWLVSYLSILIGSILLGIIQSPGAASSFIFIAFTQVQSMFALSLIVRVILAAYLYQFEYAVQRHLIAIGAESAR